MIVADYPRSALSVDDARRLEALADGYFRLASLFLGTFILGYPVQAALFVGFHGAPTLVAATTLATTAAVAWLSLAPLRRLGVGLGWTPSTPPIVALALGITAPLCCGALGFPLALGAATRGMRRLGVSVGFLGPTRRSVLARHRELARGAPP